MSDENKNGKSKKYEIVSRSEITSVDELGEKINGVSIVVFYENKLLLLKEFRMAVNRYIYNLCAGISLARVCNKALLFTCKEIPP